MKSAAYDAAVKAHNRAKTELTKYRKTLRVLSHTRLKGNLDITNDHLAFAACRVARAELAEHEARNLALSFITASGL